MLSDIPSLACAGSRVTASLTRATKSTGPATPYEGRTGAAEPHALSVNAAKTQAATRSNRSARTRYLPSTRPDRERPGLRRDVARPVGNPHLDANGAIPIRI